MSLSRVASRAASPIGSFAFCLFWLTGTANAQSGASLDFDGSDDRVTIPYDPSFPTEVFTVAAWVKLPAPGHNSAIIARGEDDNSWDLSWQMYVTRAGDLNLMVEDLSMNNFCYPHACFSNDVSPTCSINGDMFIANDQWHHVMATRAASGAFAMYVDGLERATCDQTGVPSIDNFQDLTIGCTHGYIGPPPGGEEPPTWFLPGLIDEPAMWNVALSAEQAQLVFASTPAAVPTGLVGFWAFDEGTGQVIQDLSPPENHGFRGAASGSDSADPLWVIPDCPADLDGDGDIDADDFFAYLDAFAGGDLTVCDIDADGDCDGEDFFGYLDQFVDGC